MDERGLIKISQMAALNGISRQTLILYDKNGLLEPAYVSPTGYRYYDVDQIPYLREICNLKEIGVPLSTIRSYMEVRSTATTLEMLDRHAAELDEQISRMERQRTFLRERHALIERAATMRKNVDQPFFDSLPARRAVFAAYPDADMDREKLHLTLMRAWDKLTSHDMLPSNGFGSLIRADSLATDDPLEGAGSIILLPEVEGSVEDMDLVSFPAGEYVTMYKYAMPYDLAPETRLMAWVEERGYRPTGDIVDLCLLDAIFYDDEHKEDFCRLEVPVAPKDA
jgi:DNA-binding transcriptional MerR regulator